jgi:exopolysaccharide biosynthesis polyprenyl glycosylphosphotransferase
VRSGGDMAITEREASESATAVQRGVRHSGRPRWERNYPAVALVGDLLAVCAALVVAESVHIGWFEAARSIGVNQLGILTVTWIVLLGMSGAYDVRRLGSGLDEYGAVLRAGVRLLATLAVVLYLADSDISRGHVALLIPLLTLLTLLTRKLGRRGLHRLRDSGRAMSQVLAVGTGGNVREMNLHLKRTPWAGYRVVGACVPAHSEEVTDVSTFETTCARDVLDALQVTGADVLAVTDISAVPRCTLQSLAWQLEGSGVELVVCPAVTDIAGPRIAIRPVAGLPLLHVEEPRLEGLSRWLKHLVDRAVSAGAMVCLSPLFAAVAVLIKLTSPGPVLFRQVRVGKRGREFIMLKFRTMKVGAADDVTDLRSLNESDGPMFKIRRDPRVTSVGGLLRRWSIDELPQLVNVLRGEMSIVGPRPPLPSEVAQYADGMRRRFLVRPGLTGLWQVSGRSNLPWEETVRLDLHYIDNWSPSLDLLIVAKTVQAVVRGEGAY